MKHVNPALALSIALLAFAAPAAVIAAPGGQPPAPAPLTSEQESRQASALARGWGALSAAAGALSDSTTALIAAAKKRAGATRDSAASYLSRKAAAAPRMRGVHLYARLPEETVPDSPEPPHPESDLAWLSLEGQTPAKRIILLVHGLDEPGMVWDDLAPVLADAGHTVARFDYPNDQAITASADALAAALRTLKSAGVEHVDLVCHSMGGLVARDALTRPEHYASRASDHEHLPAVQRLIMLGTPNHGSPWAHLQCLSDAAEQVGRWTSAEQWDARHLIGFLADGRGEAARDLLPGSEFLQDLNARPAPRGLNVTTIVAVIDAEAGSKQFNGPSPSNPEHTAPAEAAAEPGRLARFRRSLTGRLGDGVVSVDSARLEGAEAVYIEASHRGMVRNSKLEGAVRWIVRAPQDQPPAIPVILERLNDPVEADASRAPD